VRTPRVCTCVHIYRFTVTHPQHTSKHVHTHIHTCTHNPSLKNTRGCHKASFLNLQTQTHTQSLLEKSVQEALIMLLVPPFSLFVCVRVGRTHALCLMLLCGDLAHCIALQYAATHCNTLQHTATHCSTLQHTATHCNTLQHSETHCNTLQHTATHCITLHHTRARARSLSLSLSLSLSPSLSTFPLPSPSLSFLFSSFLVVSLSLSIFPFFYVSFSRK